MEVDDPWQAYARDKGAMPSGTYRVVVAEPDGRVSITDFGSREEALEYADDAASETDYPPPLAKVYDSKLTLVDEGKPYWSTRERG